MKEHFEQIKNFIDAEVIETYAEIHGFDILYTGIPEYKEEESKLKDWADNKKHFYIETFTVTGKEVTLYDEELIRFKTLSWEMFIGKDIFK